MKNTKQKYKYIKANTIATKVITTLMLILLTTTISSCRSNDGVTANKTSPVFVEGSQSNSAITITKTPSPEHTPSPSPTPTPIINPSLSLIAVGDLLFHDSNIQSAYNEEADTYNFIPVFEYVKPYISSADVAIANFESTAAGKEARYTGYPLFNTPDEIFDAIKDTGFDILITSNNHSLDRRQKGLLRTIEQIEKNGLLHVGTNATKDATRFLTTEAKGFKISVLSYTYACNGNLKYLNDEERSYMVNMLDEARIKADILKAKEDNPDIIIAYMHWGDEYHRSPSDAQVQLAHKMCEWGVDIILGDHPHVIQNSEIYNANGKDCYIIYSLSNFISNMRREGNPEHKERLYAEDGVMVMIDLEKDAINGTGKTFIKAVKHIPTWVDKYKADGKDEFKILPLTLEDTYNYYNASDVDKAKASYQNTMLLVKDFNSLETAEGGE